MQTAPTRQIRDEAWTATKRAVREYSKNPSEANESQVRAACSRLRTLGVRYPDAPRAARSDEPDMAHG